MTRPGCTLYIYIYVLLYSILSTLEGVVSSISVMIKQMFVRFKTEIILRIAN